MRTFFLYTIFFSSFAFAQVGIGTQNPQGIFNIDGAKDNAATGAPTASQQLNDFTVLANGNVGIGTTAPSQKLEIISPATDILTGGMTARIFNPATAAANNFAGLQFKSSPGNSSWKIGANQDSSTDIDQSFYFLNSHNGSAFTSRMMIKGGTGNVGIGTTSPSTILDIASTSGTITNTRYIATSTVGANLVLQKSFNNTSLINQAVPSGDIIGRIVWKSNTGSGFNSASSSEIRAEQVGEASTTNNGSRLIFATTPSGATNFQDRMTIADNGNIGIGTTTPATKLHVLEPINNTAFQGVVTVDANPATIGANGFNNVNPDIAKMSSGIQFKGWNGKNEGGIFRQTGSGDKSHMLFTVNTTNDVAMVINESRNVGIGTTAPSQKLDVIGAGLFRNGNLGLSSTNNQLLFSFDATTNFRHAIKTRHSDLQNSHNAIDFYTWQLSDAQSAVGTKHVMTLNAQGNVGIGTTAPAQRLHIKGINNQPASSGTVSNAIIRIDGSSNHALDIGTYANVPYGTYLQSVTTTDLSSATPLVLNPVVGNVGIGINAPATTLHVQNALAATNSVNANAQVLRLSRPSTGGIKWDNIAQFNLGAHANDPGDNTTFANSRLDLALTAGDDNTTLSNIMTWNSNGTVGIGTTAPAAPLDINNTTNGVSLNITSSIADNNGMINLNATNTSGSWATDIQEFIFFRRAGTQIGRITNDGTSGVRYLTTSDQRLKTNIKATKFGIADLMKIEVKDYNYIADNGTNPQTGFIAQQLHTVIPAVVAVGGADVKENSWQVDYSKLTPHLVKATQDLKNEVEALKKEIETLKALLQKSK